MKIYRADMDRQAEKQSERNRRRAARPIIFIMVIIYVLGLMPIIFKVC